MPRRPKLQRRPPSDIEVAANVVARCARERGAAEARLATKRAELLRIEQERAWVELEHAIARDLRRHTRILQLVLDAFQAGRSTKLRGALQRARRHLRLAARR